MSYRQVGDILKEIESVHRALAVFYDDWEAHAEDPRAQALLAQVGRHEDFFKEALARYEPQAAQGILETWIQYTPEESLNDALQEVELSPEMCIDDVAAVVLRMDQALLDAYRQLARSSSAPRVSELFDTLVELEESKTSNDAWSARDE